MELYSLTEIEGKGLGCIARKKIKKGTLVLREKPSLVIPEHEDVDNDWVKTVIEAYMTMEPEEKKEYLTLANKYSEKTIEQKKEKFMEARSAQFENTVTKELLAMDLKNIDLETAKRVFQIHDTNAFHNGVCLRMSRFNHSCSSNAEYFWNTDEQVRDLRAIRNIEAGDEITVSYIGTEILDPNKRMQVLLHKFHFFCSCDACNLSEEEWVNQELMCQNFKRLNKQREAHKEAQNPFVVIFQPRTPVFNKIKEEVECIKQMYNIAKDLKILRNISILKNIIEPGFDASCQGFYNLAKISSSLPEKDQFLKDANYFATVGFELSTTVYGDEHSISQEWQKRKTAPIQYFTSSTNIFLTRL